MSDKIAQNVSSRGRVLKKTGMDDKKMAAIREMGELTTKNLKRTDQYQIEEARQVFETIDEDEYETRQDKRRNDDFIVDDDGYGYQDKGGEIWEYEDVHDNDGDKKGKKNRKLNKQSGDIDKFMAPTSALAQKKKVVLQQKAVVNNVSAAASKAVMDNLFEDLDAQDDEELQDINVAKPAVGTSYQEEDSEMVFNKEDQINMKYNITQNQIQQNKKRNFDDFKAPQASKQRANPFANSNNVEKAPEPEVEQINSSDFQNNVAPTAQVEQNDKIDNMDKKPAEESALELEWKQIKQQSEAEKQMLMGQSKNMPLQTFDYPLKSNDDGTLSFYWFDAHEENYGADIFLFGKVWQPETKSYVSCSIQVKGMERTLFALPKMKANKARGSLSEEEEAAIQQSMVIEFNNLRKNRFKNIQGFKCKFVSRKYCFEMPISHGEHKFLKIKYPAENPPLPANLTGNTFETIFGANQSMLELFLLKRKIKGPCWLTIKNVQKQKQFKHTWCKQEAFILSPKEVEITIDDINRQSPPMTSLSFSLKTTRSQNNTNEISMISLLVHEDINQDGPTNSTKMSRFSLIRQLDKKPWPFDLTQKLRLSNEQNISLFTNERQLIEALIARFYQVDPDVLLSHNLCGSVFEILMARIQFFNIPHWSRIGRLKKSQFPTRKLDQGGYSGSSWIPRMVSCGRLLVDTFVSSKELVRETNYDLGYLAQKQLKTTRKDFDDDMLAEFFLSSDRLLSLVSHTETDTFLTFKLMLHLNILPLTKQLTNIAGNLWFRSLQNARAERNEMFLMHEFRAKKYLCPDKKTFSAKEAKKMEFGDEDAAETKTVKGKRQKAKYGGGLVLEPKAGFYDNIVMMLDFNSLYPSIIQEYNLCFTTVDRKHTKNFDGSEIQEKKPDPALIQEGDVIDTALNNVDDEVQVPSGQAATRDAILPNVLRNLVQKRRLVKGQMKTEKDPIKYQQLNIRQTALKLTANSMYGCLGFSSSRFHAQAIAALITRTGRETLLKTKEIAEDKLGFSVIYGDTDSIMINTGTTIVKEAIEMGKKLKAEVNVLYKMLEIEIDGIFKSMLLLKKKKYAALVVENFGTPEEKITTELKGLDMVRRDWCPLSQKVGNFVLKEILSGKQREDVVMSLNEYLSNIGNNMKSGDTPLSDYIITKQLTRNTTEYSDSKGLPHVQVAIRMKSQGKSDSDLIHNFIPYIICIDNKKADPKAKIGLGDKAYSPDEFLNSKNQLKVDIDWYINQQLLPPITRLIEHIEGIEIDFVAQCLGVDGKKYKFGQHATDEVNEDGVAVSNPIMKTETQDKLQDRSVATLKIKCPYCDLDYDLPEIFHKKKGVAGKCSNICPNAECGEQIPDQIIQNRVKLFLKQLQFMYYKGVYKCREPDCQNQTRQLLLANKCNNQGCKGRIVAKLTESQANDTLRYLQGLFNSDKYLDELALSKKAPAAMTNKQIANIPHKKMLDETLKYINDMLGMSKYNKVDLGSIFSFMNNFQAVAAAN